MPYTIKIATSLDRSDNDNSIRREHEFTCDENGVCRWVSNGRCVPGDLMRAFEALGLAFHFQVVATAKARDAEIAAALAGYRAAQPSEPTDEERCEARAAFGPGVEIADVITGRRYTT